MKKRLGSSRGGGGENLGLLRFGHCGHDRGKGHGGGEYYTEASTVTLHVGQHRHGRQEKQDHGQGDDQPRGLLHAMRFVKMSVDVISSCASRLILFYLASKKWPGRNEELFLSERGGGRTFEERI